MQKIRRSDMQFFDEIFGKPGYVLNVSDKTFTEYFDSEFGIDVDNENIIKKGNQSSIGLLSLLIIFVKN